MDSAQGSSNIRDSDLLLLQAAVELGAQGLFTCAPNPPVGCLIVRRGQVIGRGYHIRPGEGHAEVNAIADAGGDVVGATVYVSLEPCAFVGRTPACAETLVAAKVARVVIAAEDPHPKVAGAGINILLSAGIKVDVVPLPEALALVRGYVKRIEHNRPWIRIKTASSLDGAVALSNGESKWITGAPARKDVQYWRARSDAIITGVGTVLADNPRMTVRDYDNVKQPLRVVLDHNLRTPKTASLLSDAGATLLVHDPDTQGLELEAPKSTLAYDLQDLPGLMRWLAEQGCNEVMIEAGPRIVGSFVAANLWDEWVAYIAPMAMGDAAQSVVAWEIEALADAARGRIRSSELIGQDLRVILEREDG